MCDFSRYGGPSKEWLVVQADMPPQVPGQSLETRKSVTNAGREDIAMEGMRDLRDDIHMQDFTISSRDDYQLELRCYKPKDLSGESGLFVHLHGGGFLFGTLASEDAICSRLALSADVRVLNVNYRHTPEHKYPTAWNDAEDAIRWVHKHHKELSIDPDRIILGGISAGAWITASLVLAQHLGTHLTEVPRIAGQVLMIPCLVHGDCYDGHLARMASAKLSSREENRDAPILSTGVADTFVRLLDVPNPKSNDTFLNPGNVSVEQIQGLPPTVLGIAGLDPLRDEGLLFGELCVQAA